MKLYYYEYETSVFSAWDDCRYYLYSGFLIETPLGIFDLTEEEYTNPLHENMDNFKTEIKKVLPKNFSIVELE
jgi:hypothetical protein